jgi:hypothetical protein
MTYATDTTRRAFARDQAEESGSDLEERVRRLEDAVHALADFVREQWGEGSTDRRAYRHSANDARGDASAHPSIDAMNLRDYQQMLNEHFERQRLEQLRPPLRGDAVAGLRSAVGFDRDINWHRAAN